MGTARCPRQRFESIQETSYRVAATTGVAHMLSSSLQSLHSSYVVGSLANTYSLRGSLLSTTLNKLSLQGVLLWALGHSVRGGQTPSLHSRRCWHLHYIAWLVPFYPAMTWLPWGSPSFLFTGDLNWAVPEGTERLTLSEAVFALLDISETMKVSNTLRESTKIDFKYVLCINSFNPTTTQWNICHYHII